MGSADLRVRQRLHGATNSPVRSYCSSRTSPRWPCGVGSWSGWNQPALVSSVRVTSSPVHAVAEEDGDVELIGVAPLVGFREVGAAHDRDRRQLGRRQASLLVHLADRALSRVVESDAMAAADLQRLRVVVASPSPTMCPLLSPRPRRRVRQRPAHAEPGRAARCRGGRRHRLGVTGRMLDKKPQTQKRTERAPPTSGRLRCVGLESLNGPLPRLIGACAPRRRPCRSLAWRLGDRRTPRRAQSRPRLAP